MNWTYQDAPHVPAIKTMQFHNGQPLPYLSFPLLEEQTWVQHLFSTRMGGVSSGIFSSMNLGLNRGDDPDCVRENFRRIAEVFHTDPGHFVLSDQTHTSHVRLVTQADAGNGITREKTFFDTDGLITNEPGLVLATFYADCVPLYFADPVHHAIGLSHSGWRGTVQEMGRVTAEAMTQAYGTRPEDLICAIGPSICADCYEVDEPVAEEFRCLFRRLSRTEEKAERALRRKENGHYQLDLWLANQWILEGAGVLSEHITTTGLCTCCNNKLLFSHRATGGKRGNLGAFLMIRPSGES